MRTLKMNVSILCTLLICLCATISDAQDPKLDLSPFDPSAVIRSPEAGSSGGLVSRLDKFSVTATVNRNGLDSDRFWNNSLYIQVSGSDTPSYNNPSEWVPQTTCKPDLSTCSADQSGCYCSSMDSATGDFHLVFTLEAINVFEGGAMGLVWPDDRISPDMIYPPKLGDFVDYAPVVCDQRNITYHFGSGLHTLAQGQDYTVTYTSDMSMLTYCAEGLKVVSSIKVTEGGVSRADASGQSCVTVDLRSTNASQGTSFSLEFVEAGGNQGCGRTQKNTLTISKDQPSAAPTVQEEPSGGLATGEVAGIVVGCALAVILIGVLAVVFWKKKKGSSAVTEDDEKAIKDDTDSKKNKPQNGTVENGSENSTSLHMNLAPLTNPAHESEEGNGKVFYDNRAFNGSTTIAPSANTEVETGQPANPEDGNTTQERRKKKKKRRDRSNSPEKKRSSGGDGNKAEDGNRESKSSDKSTTQHGSSQGSARPLPELRGQNRPFPQPGNGVNTSVSNPTSLTTPFVTQQQSPSRRPTSIEYPSNPRV